MILLQCLHAFDGAGSDNQYLSLLLQLHRLIERRIIALALFMHTVRGLRIAFATEPLFTETVGRGLSNMFLRLRQNQNHLVAAIRKCLIQRNRIRKTAIHIGNTINHKRFRRNGYAAGRLQSIIMIRSHPVSERKVLRRTGNGIAGDNIKLFVFRFCPGKVQWIFTVGI